MGDFLLLHIRICINVVCFVASWLNRNWFLGFRSDWHYLWLGNLTTPEAKPGHGWRHADLNLDMSSCNMYTIAPSNWSFSFGLQTHGFHFKVLLYTLQITRWASTVNSDRLRAMFFVGSSYSSTPSYKLWFNLAIVRIRVSLSNCILQLNLNVITHIRTSLNTTLADLYW